jgi:hypothetical protein
MSEYTRMAIVELDPADSHSTGGIVIDVVDWFSVSQSIVEGNSIPADYSDAAGVYKNPYEGQAGIKAIPSETAQIGWILQDKTGVLRDPNS